MFNDNNSFTPMKKTLLLLLCLNLTACGSIFDPNKNSNSDPSKPKKDSPTSQNNIANFWNKELLHAIRNDKARPTIHARNLFHSSAMMYDIWAVTDKTAKSYLVNNNLNGVSCMIPGWRKPKYDVDTYRKVAISYAMQRFISHRFEKAPNSRTILNSVKEKMKLLNYDTVISTNYMNSAAEFGNYIADCYISYGLKDGSNEKNSYVSKYYQPVNKPLNPDTAGNASLTDMNRWQPLDIRNFFDQGGFSASSLPFLSPEWGDVMPFSLKPADMTEHTRDGNSYKVYFDPGAPVMHPSDDYKWGFQLVSAWSSHLAPYDGVMWDISPATLGNNGDLPNSPDEYKNFYKFIQGGDASQGRRINPKTNQPYKKQMVPRGDYTRVLAEFWADGPDSETPPGHWFVILNEVRDHPDLKKQIEGKDEIVSNLEWDVKAYFTLGGAMHDAAITAWSIKGYYDYIRPISAIRGMARLGQSSDANLPSYNQGGVTLMPGFVELVNAGDALAGDQGQNIGKIKIKAWSRFVNGSYSGVRWMLADEWWPYQRPSFVTPPFAGYVSGHSTYSRAAAEVLTRFTGDEFFPGGMSSFKIPKNKFLKFETGPSVDMTLQWATYRDASDQCSLSRIWGGIHPPIDDIPGRKLGIKVGNKAYDYAKSYF